MILRAAWDYIDRLDEFLVWTKRVRNLLNPPQVVVWNTDKRYLADLADAGVPTVPSRFFAPGEKIRLPRGEVVVKPAIGVGSVGALRFSDPPGWRRSKPRDWVRSRVLVPCPGVARAAGLVAVPAGGIVAELVGGTLRLEADSDVERVRVCSARPVI